MRDIVKSGVKKRKTRSDAGKPKQINIVTAKCLRNLVYEEYKQNVIPTIDIIYTKLIAMGRSCPKTTLRRRLKKLGFKYKIVDKRVAIMESKRIVHWRLDYLEKIQEYRDQQRTIYYLDETWYDTHDTASKGWTDGSRRCQLKDIPPNKGSQMIIVHCGSANGWVPNGLMLCGKKIEKCSIDYHQNMNSTIFEEWFKNTLLPNITPGSVIVMDNASYHSRLLKKIPNSSSSKQELKDFLSDNDLYFEDNYNKKQLLEVHFSKKFLKVDFRTT
uniref:Uncharacterized protein LOC114349106 n=1 Tax=Diabrotica virgifera virgifera TaxID=50390 RepID=A0A6P7H1A1_DIAVI